MITLPMLEDFFVATRETRDEGRCSWDIDSLCRWSYFFVHVEREKLCPVAEHMASQGYEVRGTLDPDDSDEDPVYFLRMDRLERHTPESLNNRNQALYQIAHQFSVGYDGMDVGAVDGP